jgi:hypothetical protein
MRRPVEDHRDESWRVHEFAADFDLLDVWRYPVRLESDVPLSTFLDFLTEANAELRSGTSPAARLFRLRGWLGRVFGWDRESAQPAPGVDPTTRPEGASADRTTPSFLGFDSVYVREDEVLFELQNATVHALMHLGRVEPEDGTGNGEWAPQMAVYVKRRGLFGRFYMAMISPFRHYIVYPAMMRAAERAWPRYAAKMAACKPRP